MPTYTLVDIAIGMATLFAITCIVFSGAGALRETRASHLPYFVREEDESE